MRILFLTVALLISMALSAQKNRDIVYLKNGSILRGTILLVDSGKCIKLKTPDLNQWVFNYDQIDSIRQKKTVKAKSRSGYFNLTEIGVLTGNINNHSKSPLVIMNVNSWKLPNGFSAGAGIGLEFFNETYLPVVADIRYYLKSAGALPFVAFQGGYAFALGGQYQEQQIYYGYDVLTNRFAPTTISVDQSARGGILLQPSVGIAEKLNDNLSLVLSMGYSYQHHRYGKESTYRMDVDYNRFSLKIGLQF
ncbi:MAG: hypothetical protein LWW85_02395 [Marinilabiliales bacterium]|nr:hypothetical protein [Marinilabiliales bacterium]